MRKYLRLIKTVLLHKWYVLVAGRRLRVPLWRLLVHDLSKLSWAELRGYARWFGVEYEHERDLHGFQRAWLHHQNRNDHHWESWTIRDGNEKLRVFNTQGGPVMIHDKESLPPDSVLLPSPPDALPIVVPSVTVVPMPMVCVREMVADWFAAGKAYNGAWPDPANFAWYKANRPKMHLHPDTEMRIGLVLAEAAQWEWK
jgi:hypothetical protein